MAIVKFDDEESSDVHDHACDSCAVVIVEDCEDAAHLSPEYKAQPEYCDACIPEEYDEDEDEILPENE